MRRVAIKKLTDYKVYPLRKAIWNFKDLLASKMLHFIDFEGNIYNYKTNKLIAQNISLTEWARNNNYNQGNLSSTARGERKQHKGVYAKYTN
jgi:hypothetical protein